MNDNTSSLRLQPIELEPCAKRRKRDDEIQQHGLLWFEDGNVILITEDRVGFKLHKSVLSLHSDLFKDMFILPQPVESAEMDGCFVVHLQDASSGMATLLKLFYNHNSSYSGAVSFSLIQDVCHLSHKYQVERWRVDVLMRLSHCYPQDLASQRHPHIANTPLTLPIHFQCWTLDSMNVVNMAIHYEMKAILPSAVYAASQASMTELVQGVSDGRWDMDDLELCLKAKEMLAFATEELFHQLCRASLPECKGVPESSSSLLVQSCTHVLAKSWPYFHADKSGTPFFVAHYIWFYRIRKMVCSKCRPNYDNVFRQQQGVAWKRLEDLCTI